MRLCLLACLIMVKTTIGISAHLQEIIKIRLKFIDTKQEITLLEHEDILRMMKFDSVNDYKRITDAVTVRVHEGEFKKIIDILSGAKSILNTHEIRSKKTINRNYSIAQASDLELENAIKEVVMLMNMPLEDLLKVNDAAHILGLTIIANVMKSLITQHVFVADNQLNNLWVGIKTFGQGLLALMHTDEQEPSQIVDQIMHLGKFVLIAGGIYEIGSKNTEPRHNSNELFHSIALKPFSIMDAAVTQEQYAKKTGTNPSKFKEKKYCPESYKELEMNGVKISVCSDHPVEMVSHGDAVQFAKLISEQDPKYIYSLPTEAQLEVAFRGGTTSDFISGDDATDLGDYVWYHDNSDNQTHPVTSKRPNNYGVFRSSVWEWAHNTYETDYCKSTRSKEPEPASRRAIRGGCWERSAMYSRSAYRNFAWPSDRYNHLGFRLVRAPK